MRIQKKLSLLVGMILAGFASIGFAKDKVSAPDDQSIANKVSKSSPASLTNKDMEQVVAGGGSTDSHGHQPSHHPSKPVVRGHH